MKRTNFLKNKHSTKSFLHVKDLLTKIIEFSKKHLFLLLFLLSTVIIVLLIIFIFIQQRIHNEKIDSYIEYYSDTENYEELAKIDKQRLIDSIVKSSETENYDMYIEDSESIDKSGYYISVIGSDYIVKNNQTLIDSYYLNGNYYKKYNILPLVNNELVSKFLLSNFKDLTFNFDYKKEVQLYSLETITYDKLLLVSDYPIYRYMFNLRYLASESKQNDVYDKYIVVKTTGPGNYCTPTDLEYMFKNFTTKNYTTDNCKFQFWILTDNYQLSKYVEWTNDRVIYSFYTNNGHPISEKIEELNSLDKTAIDFCDGIYTNFSQPLYNISLICPATYNITYNNSLSSDSYNISLNVTSTNDNHIYSSLNIEVIPPGLQYDSRYEPPAVRAGETEETTDTFVIDNEEYPRYITKVTVESDCENSRENCKSKYEYYFYTIEFTKNRNDLLITYSKQIHFRTENGSTYTETTPNIDEIEEIIRSIKALRWN